MTGDFSAVEMLAQLREAFPLVYPFAHALAVAFWVVVAASPVVLLVALFLRAFWGRS